METIQTTADVLTSRILTEESVAFVKSEFERQLSRALDLKKISAPMIVLKGTGVNDDLNGIERAVKFPIKGMLEQPAEVVQSLAKWKRIRLKEYQVEPGVGILTDMRALRPDEDLTPIHSIFVDQWDWELAMPEESRDLGFLKAAVRKIYSAMLAVEKLVSEMFPEKAEILPEEITFIHSEELLQKYPHLTPKQRENAAAKEFGAIFLMGIGGKLSHGEPHDGRAPDYDDWTTPSEGEHSGLNGDIIVWNPVLEQGFELSSMGIRVDPETLARQLALTGQEERAQLYYHQQLLSGQLPQSIGGGIGQSRLCMFLLKKRHIGEVQVSIWPESLREECAAKGIHLL